MRGYLVLCSLLGLIPLAGCRSRSLADARHVSFGLYEAVGCDTGESRAIRMEGIFEGYCLAARLMVDETDVRLAQVSRDESGQPQLDLHLSTKAGVRLRELTERIVADHWRSNDLGRVGFVIDGKLIAAPQLRLPIGDSFSVTGFSAGTNIDELAESLNASTPVLRSSPR